MHVAARKIEKFWVNDLCDIYLEDIKRDILEKGPDYLRSLNLLVQLTGMTLRLVHPFMPFITENLYQQLQFSLCKGAVSKYKYKSILQLPYPSVKEDPFLKFFDGAYMDDYEKVFAISRKIRWFRQNFFINREPLIEKIRVVSLSSTLPEYRKMLRASINNPDCQLEFVDLYDIYKFSDCYCVEVKLGQDSEEDSSSSSSDDSASSAKSCGKANSLESDEIYLLFTTRKDKLENRLRDAKLNLSKEKITSLLNQFDGLHTTRFSENYKRLTKIIS